MGKFSYIQNSFSKGELGPKLHTRGNTEEYVNGCAHLENFIPSQEGGIYRRPGTKFFYDQRENSKFIPFIVNNEVAYIVSIVDANLIQNIIRLYDPNALNYGDVGVYFAPFITPTIPTEANGVKTFPTGIDLSGYNYTQINDVMVIAHTSGTVPTLCLVRTGTGTFSLFRYFSDAIVTLGAAIAVPVALRSAYLPRNISSITLDIDTGTVGTARGCVASQALFSATKDIGRRVVISSGGTTGIFYITAVTSSTVAVITIEVACPTAATTDWAFSFTTVYPNATTAAAQSVEYPLTVSYYQQRLVFGGTRYNPDTILLSAQNNLFNFSPAAIGTLAYGFSISASVVDAIVAVPAVNEVNKIQWIASSSKLEIGTLSTEYVCQIVEGSSVSHLAFEAQTSHGGSNVMPVRVGKSTLFISRDGKRIREFIFNDSNGSFIGRDISVLNPEIVYSNFSSGNKFDVRITQIAYQESINTVWAITSLGGLLGLTIDTQSNMASWHRHSIGTYSDRAVKTISVIPSVTSDVLWLLVQRDIGTARENYTVERMASKFEYSTLTSNSTIEDDYPCFLDCAGILNINILPNLTINSFAAATDLLTVSSNYSAQPFLSILKVQYIAGTTAIDPLVGNSYYYMYPEEDVDGKFNTLTLFSNIADCAANTNKIQITGTGSTAGTKPYLNPVGFAAIPRNYAVQLFLAREYNALVDGVVREGFDYNNSEPVLIDGVNVYSQVIWGIPYTSKVKSLVYEAGGSFGTIQGSIQRIHEIIVNFYNSYYAQYGRLDGSLLDFAGMDKVTKFDSGILAKFPGGTQRGDQVIISTDEPLPLTIASIVVKGVGYDG